MGMGERDILATYSELKGILKKLGARRIDRAKPAEGEPAEDAVPRKEIWDVRGRVFEATVLDSDGRFEFLFAFGSGKGDDTRWSLQADSSLEPRTIEERISKLIERFETKGQDQ